MSLKGENKTINFVSHREQLQRCCTCGDVLILVEYMKFMVCPFCAAEEKVESEKEPID